MACVKDRKGANRVLVGRFDGERTLGRPRNNTKTNIKNIKNQNLFSRNVTVRHGLD